MSMSNLKYFLLGVSCSIIAVIMGISVSGCSQSSPYVDDDVSKFKFTEYFIKAGGIGEYSFVYDKYTKVMYAEYSSPGGFSSMTVLFNADGTVMTLNDWNNLEPDAEREN